MQPQVPATPQAPSAPPAPAIAQGRVVDIAQSANPADVFQAYRAQHRELQRQMDGLEEKRREITQSIRQTPADGVERQGLEKRMADVDQRIAATDKQIAANDADLARAAAVPGAVVEQPQPIRQGPPDEVYFLSGLFIVVVLFPVAFASARRIWKRSSAAVMAIPKELTDRFSRLEEAVDAIAVEVERVGEGQRYVTRLFTEEGGPRALGAGAAVPLEIKQREAAQVRR